MKLAISVRGIAVMIAVGFASSGAIAQTTEPTDDAAPIYRQAADILSNDDAKNTMSPGASNGIYPAYPPMSDEWVRVEQQDYEAHVQLRELLHQAGKMEHANWPAFDAHNIQYLNQCRNVANELADAAEYQSLILDDQPAAFETAGELQHLSDLLKNEPGENLIRLLVGDGIEALCTSRLMVIVSGVTITDDAGNTHDLQAATATQYIVSLLDHPDAQAELDQAMKGEAAGAAIEPISKPSLDRVLETIRRVESERDMAAMSLAAHVYRFKRGSWPTNMDDLKTELPRVPVDPWGDGTETLGYVLIKAGLPDGTDRPLVYSRDNSKDGLLYRMDEPEYGFYVSDGSSLPPDQQKHGGQFRDVTRWTPAANKGDAAMAPLP